MSTGNKFSLSELIKKLDDVRLDLKRVDQAPSYNDLVERSEHTGESLKEILNEEWIIDYKAIDSITADVYLISNPCLITAQMMARSPLIRRRKVRYNPQEFSAPRHKKVAKGVIEDESSIPF